MATAATATATAAVYFNLLPFHAYRSAPPRCKCAAGKPTASAGVLVSGAAMVLTATPACAALLPVLAEPANALSLPTWAVHVSSVVEWIAAMVLVWEYGNKSGFPAWKGLSWGMVPLLGGAFCACTWHFFYNSESLEVLVAIQAALTVIGNTTMGIAAFRIYKASQKGSESS